MTADAPDWAAVAALSTFLAAVLWWSDIAGVLIHG